jgi:hypothetical protein
LISQKNDCPFARKKKKKKKAVEREKLHSKSSRDRIISSRENNEYSSKGGEEKEEQNVEIAFRERVRDLPTDHRVGSSDQTSREFYTL